MAPIPYDDDVPDADEKYNESSDDDFNPESAPAEEPSSSEDEDHATIQPAQRRGKRKAPADEELDSGDEVTIQAARKRRTKKGKKGGKHDDEDDDIIFSEDEGGEGGLVKTRAQRRVETKERRPLARTEGATVDVDALWTQMNAAPLRPLEAADPPEPTTTDSGDAVAVVAPVAPEEEEQITVKKIYTFAGQDTTEEKQIPRLQLEKYTSQGWIIQEKIVAESTAETPVETDSATSRIRRPLRRPSRFDPNPTGYVRALPPEHQLSWPRRDVAVLGVEQENIPTPSDAPKAKAEKTQKLNVVDKSRMDWTGFVDKEGIAEELDTHGKTKEAYLGRMEFLAGVEARKEEERRNAKLKAATAAT
ncbi:swr complex subunit [Coniothyrium glycines]